MVVLFGINYIDDRPVAIWRPAAVLKFMPPVMESVSLRPFCLQRLIGPHSAVDFGFCCGLSRPNVPSISCETKANFLLFPFMEVSSQHTKESVFYRLCKTPWVWKKNIFINNRHQYMSEIWGSVSNRSKPHVYLHKSSEWCPKEQGSWGHHKAHLGPVGPRWAPCWSHEPGYQGFISQFRILIFQRMNKRKILVLSICWRQMATFYSVSHCQIFIVD